MDLMAIRRRLLMMAAAVRRVLHTITSATGIVSFSTALAEPVESLACEVTPVQDLNGYDSPWPGGSGKNILPTDGWILDSYVLSDGSIGEDSANSVDASDYIPVKASTAYIYSGTNMHSAGSSTSVYVQVAEYNSSQTFISGTRKSVNSGNISFTTTSTTAYIRVSRAHGATNTQIEKGSSATAYAPYSNVCPVGPRTGFGIHRFNLPQGYTPVDYITITQPISVTQITGLDTFNRDDLVVECTWKSSLFSGNYKAIYSTTYSAEANNITRLIYQTNATTYLVCNKSKAGGGSTALSGLPGGEWHTIVSEYGGGTVDGAAYTSSTAQGNANTATAVNFGHAGCNIAFRNFAIRSAGGTVFLQLIPCTDPDGVAGFYDLVGNRFWTTAASTSAAASGTPGLIQRYGEELVAVDWTYRRLKDVIFDGSFHYESTVYLTGSDVVTMTLTPGATSGMNVFGCYSGTGTSARNFSFFNYQSNSSNAYFRYGTVLLRPNWGTTATRTVSFGSGGTDGFRTDVSTPETEFTTTDPAWIGMLPNSSSSHFTGTIVGSIKVGNRMEFVPCERTTDGKIGYYDTLNKVFLEPVGSGTPSTSGYAEESPGPVYGGTLDVASGLMTVTWAGLLDLGSKTWSYRNGCFDTTVSSGKLETYSTGLAKARCSAYAQAAKTFAGLASGQFAYGKGYVNSSTCSIIIKDTRYTTAAAFKTAVSGVMLAYEIRTQQTYQLTPTEIAAVVGSNTVWHDAGGEITVGYYDNQ